MDEPVGVNPQSTNSTGQTNAQVQGAAPAVALSQLYLATAQALSMAAHNAAAQQQQTNMLAQAATARGVAMLLGQNPGGAIFPTPDEFHSPPTNTTP